MRQEDFYVEYEDRLARTVLVYLCMFLSSLMTNGTVVMLNGYREMLVSATEHKADVVQYVIAPDPGAACFTKSLPCFRLNSSFTKAVKVADLRPLVRSKLPTVC